MANRKKKTTTQLGKQPPRYRFFLNPYEDMRFTRCPQCDNQMHQRKLPLVIHVDPMQVLSLNKTCRYCPRCDLLIAHQDDVEQFLAAFFTEQKPEVVGSDYLVLGTLDRSAWKRGCSSRINLRTQNYHFTCKTGFFGRNKVVDWHISHFFQNFLTKNKVADSNSINLLQISKQNES